MERLIVEDCVEMENMFVYESDENDDFIIDSGGGGGGGDGEEEEVGKCQVSTSPALHHHHDDNAPNVLVSTTAVDEDVDYKELLPSASAGRKSDFSVSEGAQAEENQSRRRRKYNDNRGNGETTRTKQYRFDQDSRYSRWFRMVSSRVKEPESFLCLHCSEVCSGGEALRSHMVYNHVLEYSPGELKRGVTAHEVESGLRLLLAKCGKAGWMGKFGCACCWKQFPTVVQQREHLLQSHWDQVMDSRMEALKLGKTKDRKCQPRRGGISTLICDHCGLIGTTQQRLERHQVCRHPAQFFFKEIQKAGLVASDEDMEQATQITWMKTAGENVNQGRRSGGRGRGVAYECPVCSIRTGKHTRYHLLRKHLSAVLANLKVIQRSKTSSTCSSTLTTTTSVQENQEEEEEEKFMVRIETTEAESEEVSPSPPDIKTEPVIEAASPPPPEYILPEDQIDIKEEIYVERESSSESQLCSEHKSSHSGDDDELPSTSIPNYFDDGPNAPPPNCPHCSKTYVNFCDLDRHLVLNHSLLYYSHLVPPNTSRLVLRAALDKQIGRRKIRRKKGYQCAHCVFWSERRFTMFIHLREHIQEVVEEVGVQEQSIGWLEVALGNNPTCCPLCNAKFLSCKRQVLFHLKEKHSIPTFTNM